jgi:hypothetical protein
MQKIDPRYFSKNAYEGLGEVRETIAPAYHSKASSIVQGLPSYIASWGLHRLAGDAIKYADRSRSEDTRYKGLVYRTFLEKLKSLGAIEFDLESLSQVFEMPLPQYTQINRLAIELAREWSFWATAILGEATEP